MTTEAKRLRLADDASQQTLGPGEDTVILSLGSGYLYTCNETTARFLEALDGQRTLGEVIDVLLPRFEVSREALSRDLRDLAEKLLKEKIVVEAD